MRRFWGLLLPCVLVVLNPAVAFAGNIPLTVFGGSATTDVANMTDGDTTTYATTTPPGFMAFGFTSQQVISLTVDVAPVSGSSIVTVRFRRSGTYYPVSTQTATGRTTLVFSPPDSQPYDVVELTPSTSIRWYEVTLQDTNPSAPSAPSGVTAQLGAVPGTVDLTWFAVSGATTYKVVRNGVQIGTANTTTYTDTTPPPGTSPAYTVVASGLGGDSVPSAPATVSIPAIPGQPVGLSAEMSGSNVALNWSAPTVGDPPTGYRVYRDGWQIGTVGTNTYTDTSAAGGTTYTYTVDAFNSGGYGPQSGPAAITTTAPATAPNAPTGLSGAPGPERVTLTWSAPVTGSTPVGYRVYRDGAHVATVSTTTYTDSTLTGGAAYDYYVTAYNGAGESPPTSTVSATAGEFVASGNLWHFPIVGLGQAVSDTIGSFSPVFLIVAGLIVGGGVLSWGLAMLRSWRG